MIGELRGVASARGSRRYRRTRRVSLACDGLEARVLMAIDFAGTLVDISNSAGTFDSFKPASVALAADGSTFVIGSFTGTARFGTASSVASQGVEDIFLAKYDSGGSLAFVHSFATTATSRGFGLSLDAAGNIFLTGEYSGTLDFNPGNAGSGKITAIGHSDAFLAKLGPNGSFIAGSSYALTTSGQDPSENRGLAVAVTPDGTATFTGDFQHSMSLGTFTLTGGVRQDPFIARVSPSGQVLWANDFKSDSKNVGTQGNAVALDALGNSFVAGTYYGSLTAAPGETITSLKDSQGNSTGDAFVVKLDSAGNVSYLRTFGGFAQDEADGIAADDVGNVTVIGRFAGSAAFVTTVVSTTQPGGLFLARLTPNGDVAYAKEIGVNNGTTSQDMPSVAVDRATGTVYATASFDGAGSVNGIAVPNSGKSDIFIVRASSDGTLGPIITAGGAEIDEPNAIAADATGRIAVFGTASNPATFGTRSISGPTKNNYFLATAADSKPGGGTTPRNPPGDFNGDGKTDLAVFDSSTATFLVQPSGGGAKLTQQFGIPNGMGQPIAGDFDGDGKTDFAFFDPTTATYYIRYSNPAYNGGSRVQQFGIPNGKGQFVAGDYSGSGKDDEAVFDPVTATYYIRYANPAYNGGSRIQQFGIPNGKNQFVAGDFDGDGKTDEAVFDPVTATYYIRYSNPAYNGGSRIQQFGIPNGKNQFVVGDFSGSGKDDEAVFDPVSATYYIRYANPAFNGGSKIQQFGIPNGQDIMLSGDFDGDGKTDIAVYDPPSSTFYIQYSSGGSLVMSFGTGSGRDVPIPSSAKSNGSGLNTLSIVGGSSTASADFVALPVGAETSEMMPHGVRRHAARDAALHDLGSGR